MGLKSVNLMKMLKLSANQGQKRAAIKGDRRTVIPRNTYTNGTNFEQMFASKSITKKNMCTMKLNIL